MSDSNEFSALSVIQATDPKEMALAMGTIRQYQKLIKETLVEGHDYGTIPGIGGKPSLFKPGAEKVCLLFKMNPEYEVTSKVEDFEHGFFTYTFKCTIFKTIVQDADVVKFPISQGVGNCNSREEKYRYLWVYENEIPAGYDKATMKTKRYKDSGTVKYRIENPDSASLVNTVLKMAAKRAFVAACLQIVSLSDVFSQDLEDLPEGFETGNTVAEPAQKQAQAAAPVSKPATTGDPGAVPMNFGNKHKGKTIRQVAQDDPTYLDWIVEKSNADSTLKAAVTAFKNYKAPAKPVIVAKPVQGDDEPIGDYMPPTDSDLPFDLDGLK